MPELPEVETVRRGLAPALVGARIDRVELFRPNLRFAFPTNFAGILSGRTIEAIGRRAKYLVLNLDDGATLAIHLGMTGSLRFEVPGSDLRKHDHVSFLVRAKDGRQTRLVYNDARRFGYMLATEADSTLPSLEQLGIEPMPGILTGKALAKAFEGKSTCLKTNLLDQRVIAGLGNIYVCEALWRARLSPTAPAGSLSRNGRSTRTLDLLAKSIVDVIQEAILAGGSTLRDYRKADGSKGSFQERFDVYGRHDQACKGAGCCGTVARTVIAGRATFACDTCQT